MATGPSQYPTLWQRKVMWSSVTALAVTVLIGLFVLLVLGASKVLGFLQPILIPVAVAGILAYLLNPLVEKFTTRGISRTKAVIYVMLLGSLPLLALGWVVPQIYQQSLEFGKEVPELLNKGRDMATRAVAKYQTYSENPYVHQATSWLQAQIPLLPPKIWDFVTGSLQGFLGVFGFLLGLIVVPVYLFFFLLNAGTISQHWGEYLPLRASPFKDEVVDCLNEINSYLIAFFRGQVIVTTIDGILIAIALMVLGIPFALLIGIGVAILQLIPYVGVLVCWIPAVLIAAVQYQDWFHPIMVTVIFFIVTNLDGLFIAPRIVGESVGLHPMTIIVSVFVWSLLVGGLLGALLAVPLTATLKVLLRRYVWQRGFRRPQAVSAPNVPSAPTTA